MKKEILIFLFCFFCCEVAICQIVEEKCIFTDTKDSILSKSPHVSVDIDGNYCYVMKKDSLFYFVTKTDTVGGLKKFYTYYNSGNCVDIIYSGIVDKEAKLFYKNEKSLDIYNNAFGEVKNTITKYSNNDVALTTAIKDTLYYFINNEFISSIFIEETKNIFIALEGWCSFSENGNRIYFIKKNDCYYLYVNEKLINSSQMSFKNMQINNSGQYVYSKIEITKDENNKIKHLYYLHTQDTCFGPFEYIRNIKLNEDGSYYSECSNGLRKYSMIVNNVLYNDFEDISNIVLNKNNFYFRFKENGEEKINHNGNIYDLNYQKLLCETIDEEGNFAAFGIRDYYLYKFINGKESEKPITNYGVRPEPIYINGKGNSMYYFKTDDSIYLYQDDKLLFEPISIKKNFLMNNYKYSISRENYDYSLDYKHSLYYFEYDSLAFFMYNGKLSKPMMPIKENSNFDSLEIGRIAKNRLSDSGFFIVQKNDNKKYLVNINNKIYTELNNIDYLFNGEKYYMFDKKELDLFGIRDSSIYQFKIKL